MNRERFETLVAEALDTLPDSFARHLDNVAIVVEEFPTGDQLDGLGLKDKYELLGLYEGIPLTERPRGYAGALPDRISIFQAPIEYHSGSDAEAIKEQVRETVMHELGHYFGMDEEQLRE